MRKGSRLAVLLVDEGGEDIGSANGLGGDGGRRGGIGSQRGMGLLLGGTSFRWRVMGLRILRAGGTGRDEGELRGGEGCRAAKSARSSPRGREGGHRHLRFGVEGISLSGELVGVDGRLRVWVGS